MWNSQWAGLASAAIPPLPTTTQQVAPQPPLPAAPPPPTPAPAIAAPAMAAPPVAAVALPTMPVMNGPYGQYTAAQYAALTAEQQYALQQHWQQWQIYQQEYAKWHAQYGEQYNREMAAAATSAPVYQPPLPPQQPAIPQLAPTAPLPAAPAVPATPAVAPAIAANPNAAVVKITGAATMYKRPMEQPESTAGAWTTANYAQPPPTFPVTAAAAPLPNLQNQQNFGDNWQSNRNFDGNQPQQQQQHQQMNDQPQAVDNSNVNFNWGGQWNNRNMNNNNRDRSHFSGNNSNDMDNQNTWFGNNRNQFGAGPNNPNKNYNNNNTNNNSGNNNWGGGMRNEGNFGVNQQERNFGFNKNNNQNNQNWGNNQNWRNQPPQPLLQQQQQHPQQQHQQQQQQMKSDNSVELFDRYFHNWEQEIEEWKRTNESLLDRETFMSKVEEFDKQRNHLIERRRKIVQTRQQRSMNMFNNPNINPQQDNFSQQQSMPISNNRQHDNVYQQPTPQQEEHEHHQQAQPEQNDTENLNTTIQLAPDKIAAETQPDEPEESQESAEDQFAIEQEIKAQEFERKRKSDLDIECGNAKSTRKDLPAPSTVIINLDEEDDDDENSQELASSIFGKSKGIPGLDLVEGGSLSMDKNVKEPEESEKIAEIPTIKPTEIKDKEPKTLAQHVQESSVGNLPIVIEALRDPENLHNILKVLAKVQGLSQQEIDDDSALTSEKLLQQLPGLLQKLQNQRKNFSQADEPEAKPAAISDEKVSFAEWARRKNETSTMNNTPNKPNVANENQSNLNDSQIFPKPGQSNEVIPSAAMGNIDAPSNINFQEPRGFDGPNDGNGQGRNFAGPNDGNVQGRNFAGPNDGNVQGRNFAGPNDGNGQGQNFAGPRSNFPGSGQNFGGPRSNFGGPGPNYDDFGPNSNLGGPGPNSGGFGPNSHNVGADYAGPSSNYGGPGPNFGGPGPNFGNSRQSFGSPGQNFGGNRSNFPGPGPNRGGPNAGNFGGSGPNFGGPGGGGNFNNQGPNFRNFGGNFGNRGPNAGNNNFGGNMPNPGSDENNAFARRNPFKRGQQRQDFNMRRPDNNTSTQDMWMRDQQSNTAASARNMNDDSFYEPIKVIDYENTSTAAKVFERRADTLSSDNNYTEEFTPVKTIDYGHASNAVPFGRRQTATSTPTGNTGNAIGRFGKRRNKKNKNRNKNNFKQKNKAQQQQQQQQQQQPQQLNEDTKQEVNAEQETIIQNTTNLDSETAAYEEQYNTENYENINENMNDDEQVKEQEDEENGLCKELEEISDTEDNLPDNNEEDDTDLMVPPPPPIFSLPDLPLMSKAKCTSIFPSLAAANDEVNTNANRKMHLSYPSVENHNTISIDEILLKPGRYSRPKKICMILRGPPGSGKSFVARLIKEKEQQLGGSSIRILSIDDYFLIENDYEAKCPKTGKMIPKKEILYEYDAQMEETYMQYLIKSFKKTISDNLFDVVIVDCNNNSLRTLNEFYCHAKDSGFAPYIIDLLCDVEICLNRNVHERSEEDIRAVIDNWKETPFHYIKIDVSSLLENVVEMEDADDMVKEPSNVATTKIGTTDAAVKSTFTNKTAISTQAQNDDEEDSLESVSSCGFLKSKWETETNHLDQLARLDGISKSIHKRKATMEDYLQLDDWQPPVVSSNGKKRVRWADIEERRAQDKMREIGFVVGQTDWKRMMDPNAGARALNKTKYI